MNRTAVGHVVVAGLVLASAAGAAAQDVPVSRLLPEMVKLSAVVAQGSTGDHHLHFTPDLSLSAVPELNRAILIQAAGFPLGPTSTVVTRRQPGQETLLFGAGYTESAFTVGAKRLFLSLSYQSMTFATIDDLEIRDQLTFYFPHAPVTGDVSDRDMMQQIASLRVNRKTATFSLSRGWGDRFDLRMALPIVQMAVDSRVVTHIVRTASPNSNALHTFDTVDGANQTYPRFCNPLEDATALACHGRADKTGIGDIVLGGKMGLLQGASPVAFALDVRLPTGNADDLLGLGVTQVKPALLWSMHAGRLGTRFRADYTWSSGTMSARLAEDLPGLDLEVPAEIGLGLGFDMNVAPHTSVMLDILARNFGGVPGISRGSVVFPSRGPGPLPSTAFIADDAVLVGDTTNVTQVAVTLGLQFDVGRGYIAQASALVPVSGGGLRPQTTAVFALSKRY